ATVEQPGQAVFHRDRGQAIDQRLQRRGALRQVARRERPRRERVARVGDYAQRGVELQLREQHATIAQAFSEYRARNRGLRALEHLQQRLEPVALGFVCSFAVQARSLGAIQIAAFKIATVTEREPATVARYEEPHWEALRSRSDET